LYAKEYQVKRPLPCGHFGEESSLRDWLGEAKAKQVYLILRDRILSGAFGFGAKLPTENELAEYYSVSRVTVRRALGELARERFIERRRSAGTRVVYRPAPAPMTADISGVLANLANVSGDTELSGQGTTSRTTTLSTTLTARVTHVLPNGGLEVEATKDIQINSERQVITVRGVVRPADIDPTNSVQSNRLGELEVRVNGKGVVNDAIKRPFFLYRLLLGLLPF
jgi:DNA-binding transcriptional ArsR family regulator